jgi:hypothetical protein
VAQAIYDRSLFSDTAMRARREFGVRERDERLALCLMRIALVLFAAYVGALVVRNVTHTLCALTGQTPPARTRLAPQ